MLAVPEHKVQRKQLCRDMGRAARWAVEVMTSLPELG